MWYVILLESTCKKIRYLETIFTFVNFKFIILVILWTMMSNSMDFMYTQSKNILFDGFFGLVVVRHEGFVDLSP